MIELKFYFNHLFFFSLVLDKNQSLKMSESAKLFVNDNVSSHKVTVFSKTYCPYCTKVNI